MQYQLRSKGLNTRSPSPSRQNSTSSSLSLLSSSSRKSWNLSHPELALGTSLRNSSSRTFSITRLRPVPSRLSVLLSISRHGDDSLSTAPFPSPVLVANETVTGCSSSSGLALRAGLTTLEARRAGWGLWGLRAPLLSKMRCLRCALLVSWGRGETRCGCRLEQLGSGCESSELVSDCSLRLGALSCVTSIIFLLRCSRSLSCASRWWIQATYSFSLMANSFILAMKRCSASPTRASMRPSASLNSRLLFSASLRQCSSACLTAPRQCSLALPTPSSSWRLPSLASSFFSKASPIRSTILLVSLTTTCIFFSMARSTSRVWAAGSLGAREGRCEH